MKAPSRETVKQIREQYPVGCQVRLDRMNDAYRQDMREGLMGIVRCVDDMGTIHVAWGNGSSLGVVYGEDKCTRMNGKEEAHDKD